MIQQSYTPPILGCLVDHQGSHFGIFSNQTQSMILNIYESCAPYHLIERVRLEDSYRTGAVFHILLRGLYPPFLYSWQVVDNNQTLSEELIDPYSLSIEEIAPKVYRSAAVKLENTSFKRPHIPAYQTIIYELHIGSFTKHPSSGVSEKYRGTFEGAVEKLKALKELGVTTLELLPIFSWYSYTRESIHSLTKQPLRDVWGYNPIGLFAVDKRYSQHREYTKEIQSFKNFVEEAHKLNLEVILDVVYNHTGEGGREGPTLHMKRLANEVYYKVEQEEYINESGTGNTLNCNHKIVKDLILNSLRYWVVYMGVDGFRFDLAAILGDELVRDITQDPILSEVKLISESWDACGNYKVGQMPGPFWEWSDYCRDHIRKFVRGDDGLTSSIKQLLLGKDITHERALHFVTAHDGFTLYDLVSYSEKHNELNDEGNRDGSDCNYSDNCGIEGETSDIKVNTLRRQRMKNMMALLLLSKGVPMILMGDEIARTQFGNNNAYCQDNELFWMDWSRKASFKQHYEFIKWLIAFRKEMNGFKDYSDETVHWHGVKLGNPDLSYYSRTLAWEYDYKNKRMYVVINCFNESLTFELPETQKRWIKKIDTCLEESIVCVEYLKAYVEVASGSLCLFIEG